MQLIATRSRPRRLTGWAGASSAAGVVALVLAGCAGTTIGVASPTPKSTPEAMSSPPAQAGTGPTTGSVPGPGTAMRPELDAAGNLAFFDATAVGVLEADPAAGGQAFIDALADNGFDKAQMEVTFDRTSVDLKADSVQFSVRFKGECLIGQAGPGGRAYRSVLAPLLGSGTCLVGATRQIDW
jgi:hypothetical protein